MLHVGTLSVCLSICVFVCVLHVGTLTVCVCLFVHLSKMLNSKDHFAEEGKCYM